jgi:transcription termination/antitermination protein NusG
VQNEAKRGRDSEGGSYGIAASGLTRGMQSPLPPILVGALPQWFAVETRHRFEKKVVAQLDQKGFKVFLPVLSEHHTWSDRQKVITIPLFPGYAFVHVQSTLDSCRAILQTAGLIRFVSFGGTVIAVPAKQIEDLQLLLKEKRSFSLRPFVHTGQRVRIRGGSLHGLEGIVVFHEKEKEKLVISIESIQRSLVIEIKGYELELV